MEEPNYFEVTNITEFNRKHLPYYSREFLLKAFKARTDGKPLKVLFSEYEQILQKERNEKYEEKYRNDIFEAYRKARELENIDNEKAIGFYESIRDRKHNYDVLDRLIILYRKTKQPDKEVEAIKFLIEEEENKAYDRMVFLQQKYPDQSNEIKYSYENNLPFINPEFGFQINFRKKISRLHSRLEKLEK